MDDNNFTELFVSTAKGGSIIKVIGVGGAGGNAVNYMYRQGVEGVSFVVCNTDAQDLQKSPIPYQICLGKNLTKGLGAGSEPQEGCKAAEESLADITKMLADSNTEMVFITAGMGGGTGTGATPVIARKAKERGILTVAVVTIPPQYSEPDRFPVAIEGIKELQKCVDSLLVINNAKLDELYGELTFSQANEKADEVLYTAVKSIAEVITLPMQRNVDLADVRRAMKDSGIAFMGTGRASGENRGMQALQLAMTSPLLNNNDIQGARHILVNIMMGKNELLQKELGTVQQHVINTVGSQVKVKYGIGISPALADDEVSISLVATGFAMKDLESPPISPIVDIPTNVPKSSIPPLPKPAGGGTTWLGGGGANPPVTNSTPAMHENVPYAAPTSYTPDKPATGLFFAKRRNKNLLLDDNISEEEKNAPLYRNNDHNANETRSLYSINQATSGFQESIPAFVNGRPD
ncbi:hypothetical protein AGMMS4956_19800 [Bacteroidia bacterium]|nr:hypothetical protein AGMMS4956_19800 [Bacteroidia bacterium]